MLKERLFELRKRGYNRLYQNGQIFEFSTPESLLDLNFAEPVLVLIDRISVAPDARLRIVDAVEQGYREAGEVLFETAPRDERAGAALPLLAALRVQALRHHATTSRSRGCSRSTIHSARARAARASATPSTST